MAVDDRDYIALKKEFEERVVKKMDEITIDYDRSDMNSNDEMVLRALAQAMISLEETELMAYSARRAERLDLEKYDKLNTSASKMRADISKLQGDLKITRSVRKADKELTVADTIEDLKKRAKEFYQAKMSYVYCPKCNMLLGTVWILYNQDKRNRITLHCNRPDEYGNICDEAVTLNLKDLIEKHGTNIPESTPESMI